MILTKQEKLQFCNDCIELYTIHPNLEFGLCGIWESFQSNNSMSIQFPELHKAISRKIVFRNLFFMSTAYGWKSGDTRARIKFLKKFRKQFQ